MGQINADKKYTCVYPLDLRHLRSIPIGSLYITHSRPSCHSYQKSVQRKTKPLLLHDLHGSFFTWVLSGFYLGYLSTNDD